MKSILFTNQEWNEQNKAKYFKKYIKNKHKLREWYKQDKKFKAIRLNKHNNMFIFSRLEELKDSENIWADIMKEQTTEPIIKTKLTERIW